jgi:pantoate--beta-alanine ligase
MRIVDDLSEWRRLRTSMTGSIGLVPTMGALHDGHLSLIERSRGDNDNTVATVFVNGPQFNDQGDLEAYPRDLAADAAAADQAGADVVLAPSHEAMYPDGYSFRVTETGLSEPMEGAHRPGHFDGMLTVVLKLVNLVVPDRAYFGEKDFQQLELVRGMARAFLLPVEIVACPTVRASDGLALSSRNALLGPVDRVKAADFPALLASGDDPETVTRSLEEAGFEVDYVEEHDGRRFGAVHIGGVRLIDNIPLEG